MAKIWISGRVSRRGAFFQHQHGDGVRLLTRGAGGHLHAPAGGVVGEQRAAGLVVLNDEDAAAAQLAADRLGDRPARAQGLGDVEVAETEQAGRRF